ncbi:ATP-binding cassette domain-containing protein [Kaistia dalseonensis]|uniref:Oligopeptide/dipeptide ABC transporter ATP-binding protein n=1 Tax=Kaistia dalseonensis TaxID=410840 RepID=A0ABU0H1U2_9HYPH|nr:oligopeptide/dipeptide ABC transporter ATP-binding protein [Kaistia dalseonensis]MCX5493720.1 ATP-binding cassette domain-containing protein [Kaistia dalseonensis]MDQ0436284.1 oligopeptide/dipeptide ABC transporter ATP-binding protein [Kaistia dalseonensis]
MVSAVPILEARGLGRIFTRRGGLFAPRSVLRAVEGIDLELPVGGRLAIVGESGCGKSTLGRLLLGLAAPSAGTILFESMEHGHRSPADWKRFRRESALVQQNPLAALDPQMTIGAQVAEPLTVHGRARGAAAREMAERGLVEVGLGPEMMARFPHQLSGGQRQRVVIARALVMSPKLVVFDEAVSALDVSVQAQVVGLINAQQHRLGLSYLFISHDLRIVRHVADRIAVMYLGRIVETGPIDAIYRAPTHPYTQALLAAVPRLDPRARRPAVTIRGEATASAADGPGCAFRTRCAMAIARCASERPELLALGDRATACHRAGEVSEPQRERMELVS